MAPPARDALLDGLADAIGFTLGGLAGWWFGQALGFDFMRTPGYGAHAMAGLVCIALGCGAGRWLSRRLLVAWRKRKP